jgi:ubiquinone/menaquinone biosynthesis C-methylase UbiE
MGLFIRKGLHHDMATNLDAAANMLYCMEPLRRPVMQAIIASLQIPDGSRGLDVGCGIGLQTHLLAQAAGPKGHVTGLDSSASFLNTARALALQAGLVNNVSFEIGSWSQIPSEDSLFDWVWSMDAAGYAPTEPQRTIQELARVVKPGGRLIVGYWSSQILLPGYPALEARLNASPAGIAPFSLIARPEDHYMRTLSWMQQAGLEQARVETFVQTACAPLDPDVKTALAELLRMRWGTAAGDVPAEDWQAYLRLCQADSPDFILNGDDYYAFFTYSVFSGTAARR